MRLTLFTILISSLAVHNAFSQKDISVIETVYVSQISAIDSLEILNRQKLGTGESTILADNIVEHNRIINELKLRRADHEFLLEILFKGDSQIEESLDPNCYTPAYGLLFFDKHAGLIGFIELSTYCMKYKAIGISADWELNLDSTDYEFLENWFNENYK